MRNEETEGLVRDVCSQDIVLFVVFICCPSARTSSHRSSPGCSSVKRLLLNVSSVYSAADSHLYRCLSVFFFPPSLSLAHIKVAMEMCMLCSGGCHGASVYWEQSVLLAQWWLGLVRRLALINQLCVCARWTHLRLFSVSWNGSWWLTTRGKRGMRGWDRKIKSYDVMIENRPEWLRVLCRDPRMD